MNAVGTTNSHALPLEQPRRRDPNRLRTRTNMAEREMESWRPVSHVSAGAGFARLTAFIRKFLDLQLASVWNDVAAEVADVSGTVLDVGCGAQPFRHLFDPSIRYIGLDTTDVKAHFGYETPDTIYFDGRDWPVDDASVDFILCTETAEHVYDTGHFLAEAHRCLIPGGCILLTVPFAARWHYIPHDYWRFTPSSLRMLMEEAGFTGVGVYARGNEVTVACYKVMALILPLLLPQTRGWLRAAALRLIGIFLLPLLVCLAACGQLSLLGRGGDDCIGYTVVAEAGERS